MAARRRRAPARQGDGPCGYFALGPDATVVAKPGSELQRFLARQNGKTVRITVTLANAELSRLERLER